MSYVIIVDRLGENAGQISARWRVGYVHSLAGIGSVWRSSGFVPSG